MDGTPTKPPVMLLLLVSCFILNAPVLGMEFSLGLLGLDDPGATYTLLITNPGPEESIVTISDANHPLETLAPIAPDTLKEHTLLAEYALNGSGMSNKTINVNSTNPVRLQVLSTLNGYVEGFTAISKEELAGPRMHSGVYEYFTATFCATSGYCQFAISAFEEGAKVKLEFPPDADEFVFCKAVGYFRSKEETTIEIDRNHTVHFETASDLSGVRIYSYYPIAVFVGSRNITKDGAPPVAHMVEQLHPTANWGKRYMVRALGDNGYGDILKISTQLPNTTVDMDAFPTFVISNWNDNIWRRLDKGMVSFIKASHPIQLVQITGLAYASASDVMAASMTVVPAIENGNNNFSVSCGLSEAANVSVVSEFANQTSTVVGTSTYADVAVIRGEDYVIGPIGAGGSDIHLVSNPIAPINGIVKCKTTATMPLGLVHVNDTGDAAAPTPATMNVCKETTSVSYITKFDHTKSLQDRHLVQLGDYKIMILRVQTCGNLNLQFKSESGEYVLISIMDSEVYAYACNASSCTSAPTYTAFVEYDRTGFDCKKDVAMYWFRINGSKLHFGPGPFPYRLTAVPTYTYTENIDIPNGVAISKVFMSSVPSNAEFNYDLETEEECDVHESDWRCQDRTNCEFYGQRICTDNQAFAQSKCAKFCKLCTPDSYGRKFLVLSPYTQNGQNKKCKLVITGYRGIPNVAVGSNKRLLTVETEVDTSKLYDFPCYETTGEAIVVYSDIDVTVTVIHEMFSALRGPSGALTAMTATYTVYPVDSLGTEYMTFIKNELLGCTMSAEYSKMNIIQYYKGSVVEFIAPDEIDYFNTLKIDLTGPGPRLIKSDKPFALVCGDKFGNTGHHQMLPTATWGTSYVVPAFETNPSDLPFDLSLFIMASRKNTAVYIDGDFNAVHILDDIMDTKPQIITGAESYTVTANNPIAVAVAFEDHSDPTLYAFHQIPPNSTFHNNQMLALPSMILKDLVRFEGEVKELRTYSVTPSGHSNKIIHTTLDKDVVNYFNATEQFSISVTISTQGQWVSTSGPLTFSNFDSAEHCTTSIVVVGDGKDNDCDGLIDEDTYFSGYMVYSEDFDLDGNFKDDSCCNDATEPSPKPDPPVCLEIQNPTNTCLTMCSCNCDWLFNLEKYNQMTEAEKVVLHAKVAEKQKTELFVDQSTLSSTTAQKQSAVDDRQSAAGIGYVGIALFTIVFGMIFIMDISSLIRDAKILGGNLKEGCTRLFNCLKRNPE